MHLLSLPWDGSDDDKTRLRGDNDDDLIVYLIPMIEDENELNIF